MSEERNKVVTFDTISNFEGVVSDIRRESYTLMLLWQEKVQPRVTERAGTGDLDDLAYMHLNLLDQYVSDLLVFFKCLSSGRPFGIQESDGDI